jgi:hypothetical protein
MAKSNQPAWFTNLPSSPSKTPEQTRKGQEITKGALDIETETAKAPFAGPQAETNLKKDRLQVIRDAKTYGRDLRKDFAADTSVKEYRKSMEFYTTALSTPPNKSGDGDLVVLAVKIQDPTGAVMENDIGRYKEIMQKTDQFLQPFRNELARSGALSPQARRDIRNFMLNRVLVQKTGYEDVRRSYAKDIEDFNAQTGDFGVEPLDPTTVLGTHPATLYKDKILAYDAKQKPVDKVAERSGLLSAPEGMRVSGEDVKGFRFSPEAESSINAYTKSEGATAEGYAKMLADAAVKEGFIDEAQRGNYEAQTAIDNAEVFKLPPAQRGGINYKAIDEAASKNAGLFETVAQMGRNLPESAAQLVTGLGGMIANPVETFNTTTDLVGALLQGDADDPTLKAAATMLEEQYGGADNIKRYMIKDPLAFLGDASLLLGGSGFALKTAGLTKVGEAVSTAGRVIDPLSAAGALVTDVPAAAYRKAEEAVPDALTGIENLPSNIAGFPSNIGGDVIREGAGAGFSRGRAGEATPRSEGFTKGMRAPGDSAEDLVYAAKDAVTALRKAASTKYLAAMKEFGLDPKPLDINRVRQRMLDVKPESYDTMLDAKKRPSDHLAWEQMNDLVEHYAAKAVDDPSLLLPMQMDQFKKDLYDIGSDIGPSYNKRAQSIARRASDAVREELINHDRTYGQIMADFERVAKEADELESTFKLGQASGKPMKTDAAAKALQAIYRNNAFTGYGMRAKQGERIAELDPTGAFAATNAGMVASAPFPRGVSAAVAGGNLPLTGLAAYLDPATLLATVPILAASSPRVAGEIAYGTGRLAGTGARAFDAITGSKFGQGLGTVGTELAELYQKYPELFLAGTQAGTMLDKIDAQALADKYVGAPVAPAGDVAAEEQITVTGTRNPPQSIADLAMQYEIPQAAMPEEGPVLMNGRPTEMRGGRRYYVGTDELAEADPLADRSDPALGMYRGGTVQAFRNGGDKGAKANQSSYGANLLRQIGEGVSFGNAAETEALLRAGFMTPEYYALKAKLERGRSNWAKQNPKAALAADVGGSLVPGVLGAFVPGPGWAATASTGARLASALPRFARALDAPAEAVLRRVAPRVSGGLQQSGLGRTAVTVADEVLNGALRSVGEAPTYSEIPKQVKDDLAKNTAMALGARGVTSGGRRVVRKIRGK